MSDETYLRVCTLREGHDGDHLPYRDARDKDQFGNKQIEYPRCVHVVPVTTEERERFRVVFEVIDPRMPTAGWHEVVKEHDSRSEAEDQLAGLQELEAAGDDVRAPRLERAVVEWEQIA